MPSCLSSCCVTYDMKLLPPLETMIIEVPYRFQICLNIKSLSFLAFISPVYGMDSSILIKKGINSTLLSKKNDIGSYVIKLKLIHF